MTRYEVIVSNIGTVYSGNNAMIAWSKYRAYCQQSATGYGRAGSEAVTLIKDDEIVKENGR